MPTPILKATAIVYYITNQRIDFMSVLTVTQENFESEILKSEKTVLLDFWATWCGPCRMVSPIVDEIAEENPQYKVGKVNVDEQSALAAAFRIESIPTLIVIKSGKITDMAVGVKSKQDILNMLKK